MRKFITTLSIAVIAFSFSACAQSTTDESPDLTETPQAESATPKETIENPMTSERMADLVKKFDDNAQIAENRIAFKLRDRDILIVFDKKADRMRIMSPIIQAAAVPGDIHERMLQANFDAVLDSRYAIANEIVWSVYIHRLSSLYEDDLKSAIAQTYLAAETFGSTYTSGAMVFGGGDSNALHEDLLEELENEPRKEDQGI